MCGIIIENTSQVDSHMRTHLQNHGESDLTFLQGGKTRNIDYLDRSEVNVKLLKCKLFFPESLSIFLYVNQPTDILLDGHSNTREGIAQGKAII